MRCDICNKAGLVKGWDACEDCEFNNEEDQNEPIYSYCKACRCDDYTTKMIWDGDGYLCQECEADSKRRLP